MTGYDTRTDECHEIKIEMEEIDEPGPLDPVDPSQVLVHQMKEEEGVFEDIKGKKNSKIFRENIKFLILFIFLHNFVEEHLIFLKNFVL